MRKSSDRVEILGSLFRLSDDVDARRLRSMLRRAESSAAKGKTIEFVDAYFDTQDGRFHRDGRRLRRRDFGRSSCWQLLDENHLLFEQPISGRQSTPPRLPKLGNVPRLIPQVEIKIRQQKFALNARNRFPLTVLEQQWTFRDPLCAGCWIAGPHVLGIEMKTQKEYDAEGTAPGALLQELIGLGPTTVDPLAAGLAAIGAPLPGAPAPDDFRIRADDSPETAIRKNLAKQAYRMWGNTRGALLDLDPEFVHDLRVATRRARFALRLVAPKDQPSWAATTRAELSWIAGLLGAVRDADVFLLSLPAWYESAETPASVRTFITRYFRSRRAASLEQLVAGLQDQRYLNLLAELQAAMTEGEINLPAEIADLPVTQLAAKWIKAAARRVRRWPEPVGPVPAPQLHRLRIAFKRLRYTCEFFTDLYGDDLQTFIHGFAKMQDLLGTHQDAVVAGEKFRLLAQSILPIAAGAGDRILNLGRLMQLQRDEMYGNQVRFHKVWQKTRKQIKELIRFLDDAS